MIGESINKLRFILGTNGFFRGPMQTAGLQSKVASKKIGTLQTTFTTSFLWNGFGSCIKTNVN